MSLEIRQSELRNDNAAVMRRVAGGESFVVTVNGRAVADVVPHRRDTGRRRFVPLRALLDTSLVIDFPAVHVAKVADEVAVSAVTIGELQYGVTAAADPLTQMYRRRRVQATLDRFDVLPFDVAAAEY